MQILSWLDTIQQTCYCFQNIVLDMLVATRWLLQTWAQHIMLFFMQHYPSKLCQILRKFSQIYLAWNLNINKETKTRPVNQELSSPISRFYFSPCRSSLNRLGLPQMGLYQIHWPGFLTQSFSNDEFLKGLAKCQQQGLTQAVGVSNFKADRVRQASRLLEVSSHSELLTAFCWRFSYKQVW